MNGGIQQNHGPSGPAATLAGQDSAALPCCASLGNGPSTALSGDRAASHAVVIIDGPDQGLAAGQYAVFYDGAVCLGAAVITEALTLTTS